MTRFVSRPVWLMITVVPLLYASSAWSDPILQPIKSFFVEGPSVVFVLNGIPVASGPFTGSLAPSDTPLSNVYGLDDTTGRAFLDVNLSVQFPLLDVINQSPPTIRIIEEGPFTLVNTTAGELVVARLDGGGTVQDGSIFNGVLFTNNEVVVCPPKPRPEPQPALTCESGVQIDFSTSGSLVFPPDLGGQTISLEGARLLYGW
jgi:hypothetical protein